MRSKILPDDDDPRHGTANGYMHLGCRCDECRAARSAYQRAWRAGQAQRGLPPSDPRHGTVNGYNNLGCKCQACRQAWAEYRRGRRAVGGAS